MVFSCLWGLLVTEYVRMNEDMSTNTDSSLSLGPTTPWATDNLLGSLIRDWCLSLRPVEGAAGGAWLPAPPPLALVGGVVAAVSMFLVTIFGGFVGVEVVVGGLS